MTARARRSLSTLLALSVTAALAAIPATVPGAAAAVPESVGTVPGAGSQAPDGTKQFLPRAGHGEAALERLGDAIDEVAALNDMLPRELGRLMRADKAVWIDSTGRLLYIDPLHEDVGRGAAESTDDTAEAPYPYTDTFSLHSRPGASKTIYLDFDGEHVSGTAWNTDARWLVPEQTHPPYSLDDDPAFNANEHEAIQSIWQRVSEDYAPFDVDVTTADPGLSGLVADYGGDPVLGTRALITPSSAASGAICSSQCGGVAFVGTFPFGAAAYQPAWVFPHLLGNGTKAIAEAVSHEVGHNLGLNHDGSPAGGYYTGQGSWAPIMGSSYGRPISQWSSGEYSGANNTQDDLATISEHGLPPVPDDHGGSVAGATAVTSAGRTANGLIGTAGDRDVFAFGQGCTGQVTVSVSPAPTSPNLDVQLRLLSADGTVLATSDPLSGTQSYDLASGMGAEAQVSVTAGATLYAEVDGVGAGTPFSTGYSDYASLGRYTIASTGCAAEPPAVVDFEDASRSVAENAGSVQLTVVRTGNTSGPATVSFARTGGTATSGSDFTFTPGTLSFAAGETTKQVPVTLVDDADDEPDESIHVTLSDPGAGTALGTVTTTTLTITDDDEAPAPAVVAFEQATQSAAESAGTVQLTVRRTGNTGVASAVTFARTGGSATPDEDFTLTASTLTFAPGETEKSVPVTVVDDGATEFAEHVTVSLGSPSSGTVLGAPSSSTLTIEDDDAPAVVQLTGSSHSVDETAGTVELLVTRTGNTARGTTVSYGRSGGSATSGDDFTLAPGTVTFAAGEIQKAITVSVTDDHFPEPEETLVVTLSSPSAGTDLGATSSTTLTINDDDDAAIVGFTEPTVLVHETAGTLELTVTRTANPLIPATVAYQRTGGTASPVSDVLLQAGTVSFAAGETSRTIELALVDDEQAEGEETVVVTLGSPSAGTTLGVATVTVTVSTSDQQPDVTISTRKRRGYVGDGVHGTAPTGQTVQVPVRRGGTRSFFVRVANDGSTRSTFALEGTGSKRGLRVSYVNGGRDVTSWVTSPSGALVELLPGQLALLRVEVVAGRRARAGSTRSILVAAGWDGDAPRTDVVGATVRITR